jgi:hypothetical protein
MSGAVLKAIRTFIGDLGRKGSGRQHGIIEKSKRNSVTFNTRIVDQE